MNSIILTEELMEKFAREFLSRKNVIPEADVSFETYVYIRLESIELRLAG